MEYVENHLNDHRIRISLTISKIFLEKLSDMLSFLVKSFPGVDGWVQSWVSWV